MADNPDARMTLIEHIRELRKRLIRALAALAAGMVVGWFVYPHAFGLITGPFCHADFHGLVGCGPNGHQLIVTGVFDPFFLQMQVAFVVGLLLSSPVWLYQVWAFVAPGLYSRERRWTYVFVGAAVPLFCLGGVFAYFAMSRGLGFLLGFTPVSVKPLIQVTTYFDYVEAMLLIFGLGFELPLVLVILNLAGVLSHDFYRKYRRVMIFVVFVFAGIAVPSPDPISMLLLAIPCVVLVEAAELIIWLNDRRRARRDLAYAQSLEDDPITSTEADSHVT